MRRCRACNRAGTTFAARRDGRLAGRNVVTLSFRIGPTASGNLAVFPIVLTSIMIILHHRVGGPATAAVMANAVIGLGGFAIAVMVLNLTADRLGSPLACR